ncbi:MAG: hypothetical protein Q9195_004731 [Heterodermia aff. obscurata]
MQVVKTLVELTTSIDEAVEEIGVFTAISVVFLALSFEALLLIGYLIFFNKRYKMVLRPRMRQIKARDSEHMDNHLANTIAFSSSSQKGGRANEIPHVPAFEFYSLPPELRNRILLYALGNGVVFLPQIREVSLLPHESPSDPEQPLSYSDQLRLYLKSIYGQRIYAETCDRICVHKTPSDTKQGPRTAVGLLAASKKAYRESYGIYWSTNDFVLAPGSYKHSEYYFDKISPTHAALIQSIIIKLSIADLTPTIIKCVEHRSRQINSGMPLSDYDHISWGPLTARQLLVMWIDKLQWARKVFSHVDKNVVACSTSTCDSLYLTGDEFANEVDNMRSSRPKNDLGKMVIFTFRQSREIVRRWVREVGWENFKEVLASKCEREYGNKVCPFHD